MERICNPPSVKPHDGAEPSPSSKIFLETVLFYLTRFLFCVIIIVLGGNYGKFHFGNGFIGKRKIVLGK